MGKKTIYSGAYVRVNVESPFRYHRRPLELKDWYDAASDLCDQIKRHCDSIESTSVELDKEETCEFCGYAWTEGDSPNNGGCCEKDAGAFAADDPMV